MSLFVQTTTSGIHSPKSVHLQRLSHSLCLLFLQDYDDVQVVVLHKDIGVGLGFSLAGGVDQNKPVTVRKHPFLLSPENI